MSQLRNLRMFLALTAVAVAAVGSPSAANASTVCNQAGQAHHNGPYVATDGDTAPPARHQDGLRRMGNGQGLNRAAERSPALSQCELPSTGDGGGGTFLEF